METASAAAAAAGGEIAMGTGSSADAPGSLPRAGWEEEDQKEDERQEMALFRCDETKRWFNGGGRRRKCKAPRCLPILPLASPTRGTHRSGHSVWVPRVGDGHRISSR